MTRQSRHAKREAFSGNILAKHRALEETGQQGTLKWLQAIEASATTPHSIRLRFSMCGVTHVSDELGIQRNIRWPPMARWEESCEWHSSGVGKALSLVAFM